MFRRRNAGKAGDRSDEATREVAASGAEDEATREAAASGTEGGATRKDAASGAEGDVRSRVLDLLEDVCGDPAVRDHVDDDLFELGLLDSMAAIELLVGIEDEFGVSIAPTEVPRDEMNTANKIADQVSRRV